MKKLFRFISMIFYHRFRVVKTCDEAKGRGLRFDSNVHGDAINIWLCRSFWHDEFNFRYRCAELYHRTYRCYGVEVPRWCLGDAVNSEISKEQQEKVRNWYLENLPDKCEIIKDIKSNWIGRDFGTQYYSAPRFHDGKSVFRLCVGNHVYVSLYK